MSSVYIIIYIIDKSPHSFLYLQLCIVSFFFFIFNCIRGSVNPSPQIGPNELYSVVVHYTNAQSIAIVTIHYYLVLLKQIIII